MLASDLLDKKEQFAFCRDITRKFPWKNEIEKVFLSFK